MLIVTMTVNAQTVKTNSIYNIDEFVIDCLVEMSISDTTLVINVINNPSSKIGDCLIHNDDNPNFYQVFISNDRPYIEYLTVLAHEITHIKQLYNGEFHTNGRIMYSLTYDKHLEYDVRFEDEANANASILVRKCRKY